MLPSFLCKQILTIGCTYKTPKGGVAQVLHTYSHVIFSPFRFITSTRPGGSLTKILCLAIAWLKLICYCLFTGIQIVHIHGASYNSFWRKRILIFTAKFFRKKIIYHIHGAEFKDFSLQHSQAVTSALRKVDVVVALSQSWKTFFISEFHCAKVVVLPNIVPNPEYSEHPSNHPPIVQAVFLGYLDKRKGIFDLLETIRDHQAELRGQIQVHIGGNGKVNEVATTIRNYGIEDIALLEGWVGPEKKKQLLNAADLYLLPSYAEGLPISVLEAMSYRLPILSTPVGGIPEIVKDGENGCLVKPGDHESLFLALKQLISQPDLRRQMGQASWQKVQPYLPENIERELDHLYTDLLNEHA